MPIFTIVFERRGAGHDYRPLQADLQAQRCFPLWENAWLGSFNNNATQVHNHFKRLLADADRIAVCEMTNHFCYSGVVQGANRWLELNPPAGGLDGVRAPEAAASAPPPAKQATPRKTAGTKKQAKAPAPGAGKRGAGAASKSKARVKPRRG